LLTVARAASFFKSLLHTYCTSRSERLRLHAASWVYRRHTLTWCSIPSHPILPYPAIVPQSSISPSQQYLPLSNPPQSPPPPLLSTRRSATIRGCPIAQRQKSILQHCTRHASRYRQHGCYRVMIGSVCRTTPTTQAPLRRPMRQPLPSHAPKASPRLCRTTAITTTSSNDSLRPAIPRHSLEPG
jgi:hypothetical protein